MQDVISPAARMSNAAGEPQADAIDVSGFDAAHTLKNERRRQVEAALSAKLGPIDAMLLPLALALARLTARQQCGGAA